MSIVYYKINCQKRDLFGLFSFLFNGWVRGPVTDKGTCHQVWWSQFNPQDLQWKRRASSCKLSSDHHMSVMVQEKANTHARAHTRAHTHIPLDKQINSLKIKKNQTTIGTFFTRGILKISSFISQRTFRSTRLGWKDKPAMVLGCEVTLPQAVSNVSRWWAYGWECTKAQEERTASGSELLFPWMFLRTAWCL